MLFLLCAATCHTRLCGARASAAKRSLSMAVDRSFAARLCAPSLRASVVGLPVNGKQKWSATRGGVVRRCFRHDTNTKLRGLACLKGGERALWPRASCRVEFLRVWRPVFFFLPPRSRIHEAAIAGACACVCLSHWFASLDSRRRRAVTLSCRSILRFCRLDIPALLQCAARRCRPRAGQPQRTTVTASMRCRQLARRAPL